MQEVGLGVRTQNSHDLPVIADRFASPFLLPNYGIKELSEYFMAWLSYKAMPPLTIMT